MDNLIAKGVVERAGPFYAFSDRVEGDLVGLVVFATSIEKAARLSERDPAVQAGVMTCDILPWHP